jgi:cobalt-precorrin 5A hydrolase
VVVVDEAGRFAVSVLGGHQAGANELARRVAKILKATPVITTASESLGLPAVDLIGHELGWKIERSQNLTRVAAAVVNGRPVAVYQDAGHTDWWQRFGPWPEHFQRIGDPDEVRDGFAAALVISDRAVPPQRFSRKCPCVIFRPPTLHVGVGCRRGVDVREVQRLFDQVMRRFQLAPGSVATMSTAWIKKSEPALLEFSRRLGVGLGSFSRERLLAAGPLPTPSERVFSKIGLHGVAEPSAMLAAGTSELVVPKQASKSVTIAVAREKPS